MTGVRSQDTLRSRAVQLHALREVPPNGIADRNSSAPAAGLLEPLARGCRVSRLTLPLEAIKTRCGKMAFERSAPVSSEPLKRSTWFTTSRLFATFARLLGISGYRAIRSHASSLSAVWTPPVG